MTEAKGIELDDDDSDSDDDDDDNCVYIKKDGIDKEWKNVKCSEEVLSLCERRTRRELFRIAVT